MKSQDIKIQKLPIKLRTVINKAKVIKELKATYGTVNIACNNACISRSQFYHWLNTDVEFSKKVFNIYKAIQCYAQVQAFKRKIDINDPKSLEQLVNKLSERLSQQI